MRDAQRWQVRIALARSFDPKSSKTPEMSAPSEPQDIKDIKVSEPREETLEQPQASLDEHSPDSTVKPAFKKPVYEEEEELTLKVKSVDGVPSYSVEAAPPPPARLQVVEPTEEPVMRTPGQEPVINRYLRQMMERKASDLHMSSEAPAMVRVHGEIQRLEGNDIISRPSYVRFLWK